MSHLAHEQLWGHARHELDEAATASVTSHLQSCAACQSAFDEVLQAQSVLSLLPPAPPMPEVMARRVGQQLAEAVDARAAARLTSWWRNFFSTPVLLAAAALAIAGVVATQLLANEPTAPAVALVPAPAPQTPGPVPVPSAPRLSVTVASARKASTAAKQVLQEGSVVTTQRGGSAWLRLPDGSRAGVTSASEVTLARLEAKALTLDVARGSVALVVPHREDRVLTVRAGELEVKDLGTRFLVSREASMTLVAVEEGVVEVKTPTETRQVRAGHAVSWKDGKLAHLDWETAPPPPAVAPAPPANPSGTPPIEAVAPPQPQHPDSVARLEEEDEDDAPLPPAEEAPVVDVRPAVDPQSADRQPIAADEQWAKLPPKAGLPPVSSFPRAKSASRDRAFSLRTLERKLRELGSTITSGTGREARARNIILAGEAGDCAYALSLADGWLREPATNLANEPLLRRSVQVQQVRCLNHLGRGDEAQAIEAQLETK